MTNFPSVSIRMAKEQDLPLNPQKISGGRGRIPARPPRQGQPEGMGNQGQRPNRPPRPERPAPGQANTQPAQPAPSPAGEGEAQKRRRRRRRGRGGGGGGGSDENQATSD